jgi:hypothetical protein
MTLADMGVQGLRAQLAALRKVQPKALEYLDLLFSPEASRDAARMAELAADPLTLYTVIEAEASVLCPACKLWNTGHGAVMMREAVALMGGYGITEDCPGFLFHKWTDCQLEATYEGPEPCSAPSSRPPWSTRSFWPSPPLRGRARGPARRPPGTGREQHRRGFRLWLWTLTSFLRKGRRRQPPVPRQTPGVTFPWPTPCVARGRACKFLDVVELAEKGPGNPILAEGLKLRDLFSTWPASSPQGRRRGRPDRKPLVNGFAAPDADTSGSTACAWPWTSPWPAPARPGTAPPTPDQVMTRRPWTISVTLRNNEVF